MKKSVFGLAWFVFVTMLSIFVPAYVLITGSATLMPVVMAGVAVTLVGGIGAFAFAMASIYAAEKKQSVKAHEFMVSLNRENNLIPLWRKLFLVARFLIQAVLLLALGSTVAAGLVISSLVAVVLVDGMIEAYFSRLPRGARGSGFGDS